MKEIKDKLRPEEEFLIGQWILKDGHIVEDENCLRIKWLIKSSLMEISKDYSGWFILYKDTNDNRLWELSYPNSELHVGGSQKLSHISNEEAVKKYKL